MAASRWVTIDMPFNKESLQEVWKKNDFEALWELVDRGILMAYKQGLFRRECPENAPSPRAKKK